MPDGRCSGGSQPFGLLVGVRRRRSVNSCHGCDCYIMVMVINRVCWFQAKELKYVGVWVFSGPLNSARQLGRDFAELR